MNNFLPFYQEDLYLMKEEDLYQEDFIKRIIFYYIELVQLDSKAWLQQGNTESELKLNNLTRN